MDAAIQRCECIDVQQLPVTLIMYTFGIWTTSRMNPFLPSVGYCNVSIWAPGSIRATLSRSRNLAFQTCRSFVVPVSCKLHFRECAWWFREDVLFDAWVTRLHPSFLFWGTVIGVVPGNSHYLGIDLYSSQEMLMKVQIIDIFQKTLILMP
jgi:hypothetical protein